ncbi:hypothetical protein [Neptuniibacter halophilus]|uniref:hypothetical protein n=1 Tax=Neptuniibacter halophilus TaxID=651666 RepID=UPI0025738CC7|nr:hypothetical protein [Neptuniibacter halophilus]
MKSDIAEAIGYIPLADWCEFEGVTTNAITVRLSKGIWQKGVHVVKPRGGRSMVNLKAAKRWLEGKSNSRAA